MCIPCAGPSQTPHNLRLTCNCLRAIIGLNLFVYFFERSNYSMSTDFIARIIGMLVFAVLGAYYGNQLPAADASLLARYTIVSTLIGMLVGLILTPYISTRPIRFIRKNFNRLSVESIVIILSGLIAGLLIAALLAFPLSLLPDPFGEILPFVGVCIFVYFGISLFSMRQNDISALFTSFSSKREGNAGSGGWQNINRTILLDTSVIIDGRVADIAKTGFLPGTMLIPRFVLLELQYIADSSDAMRRQRGRRGMEVLAELQKGSSVAVRISDIDVEGVKEVDDKLVILARQMKCPILTNDYNLNRIAEIQGVTILNINELANSVKSVVLPGEILQVSVIQEGKESGQGVGYMEDGTMVVVENGNKYLNKDIQVSVTKVLQTAAGRMIFAKPEGK
jgi:uncharacterized protein YacL